MRGAYLSRTIAIFIGRNDRLHERHLPLTAGTFDLAGRLGSLLF